MQILPRRSWPALLALLLLPGLADGQVPEIAPPSTAGSPSPLSISVGPGVTATLNRPGDWSTTLTVALGYALDDRFTVTIAPYWERENDQVLGETFSYDEITLALGCSYAFAPRWTVSGELDLGLVHDAFGPWERNPEYGVAVGISYAIPAGGPWSIVIGPTVGWKFSDDQWTIGFNTGVSLDL